MARSLLLALSFVLVAAAAACGGGGDPDTCDVEPGTYVVTNGADFVNVLVDDEGLVEIVGDSCSPVLTGSACGGVVSCTFGGSDPVTITVSLALDEGLADLCFASSAGEDCGGFRPVTRGL